MRRALPLLVVAILGSTYPVPARSPAPANPSELPPAGPLAQIAPPAAQGTPDYGFPSGAGMLFFYVRPDRAADFEGVLTRLDQALAASADPVRQQQAAGWRMYRSLETHAERIYVFAFDPMTSALSYDPVRVLGDLIPLEVNDLYGRLKGAIIRVERMGLAKIR